MLARLYTFLEESRGFCGLNQVEDRNIMVEMVEEETYIEIEKIPETRDIERINNRFSQKIAEIKRLQEGLDLNIRNLKALVVIQLEDGYSLTTDGHKTFKSLLDYTDWYSVDSVVASKKGDNIE
jgi:hypothetical protein